MNPWDFDRLLGNCRWMIAYGLHALWEVFDTAAFDVGPSTSAVPSPNCRLTLDGLGRGLISNLHELMGSPDVAVIEEL